MTTAQQQQAARNFAAYWKDKGYEKGESQPFWLSLLRDVYGVEHPEQFIQFEEQVHLDHTSFIDGTIPATHVLIEQKGLGKDLNKPIKQSDGALLNPFEQAKRYILELPVSQHPRWVVTCNFSTFYVYDMERPRGEPEIIELANLEKEYYRLQFLVDAGNEHLKREMEVSIAAGEIVGLLYDAFYKQYANPESEHSLKSLNKLCVRLVFCLYAEDAGIFGHHGMFHDYLKGFDTRGLRKGLVDLFRVLDTKLQDRDPYLKDDNPELAAFPYVNGGLFSDENIEIPPFTDEIRDLLLVKASENFNWSEISPTIFGAVFESTLNPETRRSGGMHYTSIENIHKVIDPLFLDELKAELDEICANPVERTRTAKLRVFQRKLASLTFLDPACGSGNFLTETYLSLRRLENKILVELSHGQVTMYSASESPIQVSISQFYGIEVDDFAHEIAMLSLWLAEHQMNQEFFERLGKRVPTLPLRPNEHIVLGNALRLDWETVCPKTAPAQAAPLWTVEPLLQRAAPDVREPEIYIFGNPPYLGGKKENEEQKQEQENIFSKYGNNYRDLDYVSCWLMLAAEYMQHSSARSGFVCTNSITQGTQVPNLWKPILGLGVEIGFAYASFKWSNNAKYQAGVSCVILGLSHRDECPDKTFYQENKKMSVSNITPYLTIGKTVFVEQRNKCLNKNFPAILIGNAPVDGGHLILTETQKDELVELYPESICLMKKYMGADELIKGKKRYCLWIENDQYQYALSIDKVCQRIDAVKSFRLQSKKNATKRQALNPHLFMQRTYKPTEAIIIPGVSSEKRGRIPMGYVNDNVIISHPAYAVYDAKPWVFGILSSKMHMVWALMTCGRLGTGLRYSATLCYNTFPLRELTEGEKARVTEAALRVLDAREAHPEKTPAELYDPDRMPENLRKAHDRLDAEVDRLYRVKGFKDDGERLECLFELYREMTQGQQTE